MECIPPRDLLAGTSHRTVGTSYGNSEPFGLPSARVRYTDANSRINSESQLAENHKQKGTTMSKKCSERADQLRIKAGKYYRQRGGMIVGPVVDRGSANGIFRFECSGATYRQNGMFCTGGPSEMDLVEEVSETADITNEKVQLASEITNKTVTLYADSESRVGLLGVIRELLEEKYSKVSLEGLRAAAKELGAQ